MNFEDLFKQGTKLQLEIRSTRQEQAGAGSFGKGASIPG